MHLMRCLTFFLSYYDIVLFAEHLPGKDNIAADALSWNNLPLFHQQVNHAAKLPTQLPQELILALVVHQPDWTSEKLESLVQHYFAKGLAPSTQRTYMSAQERFLKFCLDGAFTQLQVKQSLLCAFVSYLADQKLKHGTIKLTCQQFRICR